MYISSNHKKDPSSSPVEKDSKILSPSQFTQLKKVQTNKTLEKISFFCLFVVFLFFYYSHFGLYLFGYTRLSRSSTESRHNGGFCTH